MAETGSSVLEVELHRQRDGSSKYLRDDFRCKCCKIWVTDVKNIKPICLHCEWWDGDRNYELSDGKGGCHAAPPRYFVAYHDDSCRLAVKLGEAPQTRPELAPLFPIMPRYGYCGFFKLAKIRMIDAPDKIVAPTE